MNQAEYYNIKQNKDILQQQNQQQNYQSFLNQLTDTLKSTSKWVWTKIKDLDFKNKKIHPNDSNNSCIDKIQPKSENQSKIYKKIKINDKLMTNQPRRQDFVNQKQSQQNQGQYESQNKNKKQKMKQKKLQKMLQSKRISFDEFLQQKQRQLNQSFIRRNIENKKSLNKPITQNLNQSQLSNPQNKNNQEMNNNLNTSVHIARDTVGQINNLNETILNISDIDSADFNYFINNNVNNQGCIQYGQSQGSFKKKKHFLDLQGHKLNAYQQRQIQKQNFKEKDDIDEFLDLGQSKNNQEELRQESGEFQQKLELRLREYPIFTRTNYHIKSASTKLKNHKLQSRKGIIRSRPIEQNSNKKRYIEPNLKKYVKSSKNQIQIQPSYQNYQKFDKLINKRHQKIIEETIFFTNLSAKNINKQNLQNNSLKQDFELFVSKNFPSFTEKKLTQEQKINYSQLLKHVDHTPKIQKKKLYSFTKQCQSKVQVKSFLRKVVTDHKIQQIQQKKRIQEEQINKKIIQQQKKRQFQQRQIQLQLQAERKRLLQEENQKRKQIQLLQQQKNQQKTQEVQVYSPVQNPNIEGNISLTFGPKKNLFDVQESSLFPLVPKYPSAQNLILAKNIDDKKQEKQNENEKEKGQEKSAEVTPNVQKSKLPETSKVQIKSPKKQGQPQIKQVPIVPKQINPFLAAPKSNFNAQNIMQGLIETSTNKSDSMFKTSVIPTIPPSPVPSNSSKIQNPNTSSLSPFTSPLRQKNQGLSHNNSYISNVDSSMCEEDESNITPGNSNYFANNTSFLNQSYSSNVYQTTPQTPFGIGSSLGQNTGSSLFSSTPGFNLPSHGKVTEIIPSFMPKQSNDLFQQANPNAVSLFMQKSPSKAQQPSSIFSSPIHQIQQKQTRGRKRNKQERIG